MLQYQTIDQSTFELIRELQKKEYLKDFILVGGTSLALQLGHRKSVDIDLFITKDFDVDPVLEQLESDFIFNLDKRENNTILGSIKGVKVDLIAHKYTLLSEPLKVEGITLASSLDIAAMKLNAISGNGTRVKDFIDIYFLLNNYTIEKMVDAFEQKYETRNSYHVIKSLNYFDEVQLDDWPEMMNKQISWKEIKIQINREVINYSKSLLKKHSKNIEDI